MEHRSVARGDLDHGRGGLGICCVACFAGTDPECSALRLLLGAMGIVDFGVGVVNAVVAVRYCFDDSTPKKRPNQPRRVLLLRALWSATSAARNSASAS